MRYHTTMLSHACRDVDQTSLLRHAFTFCAALFSRTSRSSEAKLMKRYHNVMNGIQKFLADPKTNKSSQLIVFN